MFDLQVAAILLMQPTRAVSYPPRASPVPATQDDQRCPGVSSFRSAGEVDEHDGVCTRPVWPCLRGPDDPQASGVVVPGDFGGGGVLGAPRTQCARCGAVGTHFLTCPGLRLPSGYRLGDAPGPENR